MRGEADDAPAREGGFEILFGIGGETGAAGMPAAGVATAFDFDEHAVVRQGEVGAPLTGGMEAEFRYDRRAAGGFPKEKEVGLGIAHGKSVMKAKIIRVEAIGMARTLEKNPLLVINSQNEDTPRLKLLSSTMAIAKSMIVI